MARRLLLTIILALFLFTVRFVITEATKPVPSSNTTNQTQVVREAKIGRIGEGYFTFELANTAEKRTLGLSGRDKLQDTTAMLFTFDQPSTHCIWMKDMKFNIDIMWFDENKVLIFEKRNASPESYPERFCPEQSAKYVVEVSAGVAEKNQIKLGSILDIEL